MLRRCLKLLQPRGRASELGRRKIIDRCISYITGKSEVTPELPENNQSVTDYDNGIHCKEKKSFNRFNGLYGSRKKLNIPYKQKKWRKIGMTRVRGSEV